MIIRFTPSRMLGLIRLIGQTELLGLVATGASSLVIHGGTAYTRKGAGMSVEVDEAGKCWIPPGPLIAALVSSGEADLAELRLSDGWLNYLCGSVVGRWSTVVSANVFDELPLAPPVSPSCVVDGEALYQAIQVARGATSEKVGGFESCILFDLDLCLTIIATDRRRVVDTALTPHEQNGVFSRSVHTGMLANIPRLSGQHVVVTQFDRWIELDDGTVRVAVAVMEEDYPPMVGQLLNQRRSAAHPVKLEQFEQVARLASDIVREGGNCVVDVTAGHGSLTITDSTSSSVFPFDLSQPELTFKLLLDPKLLVWAIKSMPADAKCQITADDPYKPIIFVGEASAVSRRILIAPCRPNNHGTETKAATATAG